MENGAATQASEGKDPSSFLSEIIGNPVTVKLNSGVVYKGKCFQPLPPPFRKTLAEEQHEIDDLFCGPICTLTDLVYSGGPGELQSVDGYMNIALEKTEEYVNGTKRRSYGDAFVRGNNGQYLSSSHSSLSISSF